MQLQNKILHDRLTSNKDTLSHHSPVLDIAFKHLLQQKMGEVMLLNHALHLHHDSVMQNSQVKSSISLELLNVQTSLPDAENKCG